MLDPALRSAAFCRQYQKELKELSITAAKVPYLQCFTHRLQLFLKSHLQQALEEDCSSTYLGRLFGKLGSTDTLFLAKLFERKIYFVRQGCKKSSKLSGWGTRACYNRKLCMATVRAQLMELATRF